jgi:hypothetical protein
MEWWEDASLDKTLWRDYKPFWHNDKTRKRMMNRFNEWFPFDGGVYDEGVMERAVWRKMKRCLALTSRMKRK